MNSLATSVESIPPVRHDEAMRLAEHEYVLMLDLLRTLDGDDWTRPTDCTEWDVRAMALHLLGAAAANASLREAMHQFRDGKKLFKEIGGEFWVDGMNELQIRERSPLSNEDIVREYAAVIPAAVRTRSRLPRAVRALPFVALPAPYDRRMTVGWLMDLCYTRDVWMHRVDIARATGRELVLAPEHDGRLVADMIAEWVTTHTDPFDLELTGPAGGHYRRGSDGEHVRIDAVEFMRILSLRAPGAGVLRNPMPL